MHHPTNRITHTTSYVTPVVEHWQEGEIAQWVHSMKDRSSNPSQHERTLLPRSYISLLHNSGFPLSVAIWLLISVLSKSDLAGLELKTFTQKLTFHAFHMLFDICQKSAVVLNYNFKVLLACCV